MLVDDRDDHWFENLRFYVAQHGYVKTTRSDDYLHRLILGLRPRDGKVVDHINGNKLDNRRSNLRVGTQAENMQNVRAHRDAKSRFRGVSWSKSNNGWIAQAMRDGVRRHLGTYVTEEEAAQAVEKFWNGR